MVRDVEQQEGGGLNYYQHHIGDYAMATAHLSWDEDQAYSRLLRAYYHHEKPIPADLGQAARLIRATRTKERKAMEAVLKEFFALGPDGWHQKRCDEEIIEFQEKSEKARRSANAKWANRERIANALRTHSADDAGAMPTHTDGNAPILHTHTHTQEPNPEPNPDPKPKPKKRERGNGAARFSPPTLPEVREYCEGINSVINPVTFFNHYESVGWKVGKNPMKNWRAAVRGWNSREGK